MFEKTKILVRKNDEKRNYIVRDQNYHSTLWFSERL